MNRCPGCGAELRPGARYCTGCGRATAESGPAWVASAPAPIPAADHVPGGKTVAAAVTLHLLYPGFGLLYAGRVALGVAHTLVTTVGLGTLLVVMWRVLTDLLTSRPGWDNGLTMLVLMVGLVIFWTYGLLLTRRVVKHDNLRRRAGLPAGTTPARLMATIVWELLALVALNLLFVFGC